ncbi:hypothetical protein [Wukongibacter sp. M2B1]|uniref:hypothetical protein n=1 Tax=Wukongibacter sp. M2B1 TaxID=3088895 RepID=UPI003D796899
MIYEYDFIDIARIDIDESEDTREVIKEIDIINNLLKQKVRKTTLFFIPDYYGIVPVYDFRGNYKFSIRGKRYIEIYSTKKNINKMLRFALHITIFISIFV